MAQTTVGQLAQLVQGKVVGNAETIVNCALPLQDSRPNCITLASHARQYNQVVSSGAAAVLVTQEAAVDGGLPLLIVQDLHSAFHKIITWFRPHRSIYGPGVHAASQVDVSAVIGEGTSVAAGASIAAGCIIGKRCVIHGGVHILPDCTLGDDCILFPGAVLYENTQLGNRVIIHANAVLGAFGFGYREESGKHVRTAQLGWVELGDDVEIGATTTVDRGTYGATKIGEGTKIDNIVQIGHNCHIGRHNLICAQTGIAGSSSTGDYVVLAGQVGITDHVHLNDRVTVGAQSGVINDVAADEVVLGTPARARRQKMLEFALASKLPEMRSELKKLIQRMNRVAPESSQVESSESEQRDAA